MVQIQVRQQRDGEAIISASIAQPFQVEHLEREVAEKLVALNPDAVQVVVELRCSVWNPVDSGQRGMLPTNRETRESAYSHQLHNDLSMLRKWESATTDESLRKAISERRRTLENLFGASA